MKVPDPTQMHIWFDDFDNYEADQWVVTVVDSGEDAAHTQAIQNEDGGVLKITNNDADDDSTFLQYSGDDASAAVETFKFEPGKKLMFKARWKLNDATQNDAIIGLQITDTTPLDATDGVIFRTDDGDTNLDFHVTKNSTSTSASAIGTLADDTYVVTAFYYNGVDAIKYYVDGVHVGTAAVTNLPDDEELTVSFGIQNGEAAANTMSVDYILVAKER